MRRSSAVAVLLFLGTLASLGGAAPAFAGTNSASIVAAVPAADPVIPDPKSFNYRSKKFMLNTTGKMLGKAMPTSWKREQIATNQRFDHSMDQLSAMTGVPMDAPEGMLITTDWNTKPQTATDWKLKRMEASFKSGKDGKEFRAPATAANKFMKGAGAAASAYTGFSVGAMVGQGLGGAGVWNWFGVNDVDSTVCSGVGTDTFGKMAASITGADCDAWAMPPTFVKNGDVNAGFTMSQICRPYAVGSQPANTECVKMPGSISWVISSAQDAPYGPAGSTLTAMCYGLDPAAGRIQGVPDFVKYADGTITSGTNNDQSAGWKYSSKYGAGKNQCTAEPNGTGIIKSNATGLGWKTPMPDIVGMAYKQNANDTAATAPFQPLVAAPADPERSFQCSVLGTNGQTYTKQATDTYKESEGEIAAPECPELPQGVGAANVKIDETKAGAAPVPVYDSPTTQEYRDWATNYPECGFGNCKLDLLDMSNSLHPASCFDLEEACKTWFDDPNRATKYKCRYGQHDVDISECFVYSGIFQPERLAVGAPYSDPLTGVWSGGQQQLTPDKAAMGQTIQSPLVTRSCDGMAITGFDPVGFVMRPMQCAMEWAFVPRPAVVSVEMEKSKTSWAGTPPGKLVGAVEGWAVPPSVSGCGGIQFTMFEKTASILDACPGSMLAPTAAMSNTISGVVFVLGGGFAIVAIVASVIGYRGISKGGND